VLGFADVDAGGVGVEDLEWASECWRLRGRRSWWTRVKKKVFVGCHGNLQKESTNEEQPWGRE
jgi:hypothetical protein